MKIVEAPAKQAVRFCVLFASLISGFVLLSGAAPAAAPQVATQQGIVQGFGTKGISEFLGIPYATPPLGNLRWRPPVPAQPWKGVLRATKFGPTCAQITTGGVYAGPPNDNEDCLTLNVFTPGIGASNKLPVLVWIHGGGNFDGESRDYDGSGLARLGRTVVVTINYRLGLLGWLAVPALDAEGHLFGNYGLLDQQLALKWVQANIAGFGGDPGNVTLSGQSAGSFDTEANVVSPLAAGLFHRAIFESSVISGVPLAKAEKKGAAFAKSAGCGEGSAPAVAACLRQLPVQKVIPFYGTISATGPYLANLIEDGRILPASGLFTAFKNGTFNHMPIMSGTAHDERVSSTAAIEYFSGPPRHAITAAQFQAFVTNTYPPDVATKIFSEYRLADYASPQLAFAAVGTDSMVCPQLALNRILASQVPVYAYEFNDRTAPLYYPSMPGFKSLAYHTSDIQYLFPLWHGSPSGIAHPLNAQQRRLSDAMVKAWTNFARTGNPNGPGAPNWPAFKPTASEPGLYLSETIPETGTITAEEFSHEHKCDFWAGVQSFGMIYDLPH